MAAVNANVGRQQSSILIKRPKFSDLWDAYPKGELPPSESYKKAGGSVYQHYLEAPEIWANSCAVKMSHALNEGGHPLTTNRLSLLATALKSLNKKPYARSGGNGKPYLFRVSEIMEYLKVNWGKPEIDKLPTNGQNISGRFKNMKGVIIFHVPVWARGDENGNGGATGHVTLWNGGIGECSDKCYFGYDGLESISLWILKD